MWTDMHPTWAYEVTTATTMPSSIHWAARPPYHLPLALPVSLRVTGMGVVALVLPAPHPIAVLSTPPRQFYHLTPTEMVERRCQGLYYNCDVRVLPPPPPPPSANTCSILSLLTTCSMKHPGTRAPRWPLRMGLMPQLSPSTPSLAYAPRTPCTLTPTSWSPAPCPPRQRLDPQVHQYQGHAASSW
jgi:hypothetical protein